MHMFLKITMRTSMFLFKRSKPTTFIHKFYIFYIFSENFNVVTLFIIGRTGDNVKYKFNYSLYRNVQ